MSVALQNKFYFYFLNFNLDHFVMIVLTTVAGCMGGVNFTLLCTVLTEPSVFGWCCFCASDLVLLLVVCFSIMTDRYAAIVVP